MSGAHPLRNWRACLQVAGVRVATGIAGVGALKVGASLLGLAATLLLARWLAPDGMGRYAFVLSVVTLATLPLLQGLPLLVVREVATAGTGERLALARALLRFGAWATVLVGALVAVGIAAWQTWRPAPEGLGLWLLALAVPLFMVAGLARSAVVRARGKPVRGHLPDMLVRPAALLVGLGVAGAVAPPMTPPLAMAVHACAAALAFLVAMALSPALRGVAAAPAAPRRWLATLLPLSTVAGIQLVNSQLELVVLGAFRPPEEVGLYRIASLLALQTSFLLTVVNAVAAPLFASHHRAGRIDDLRRLQRASAVLSLGFGALVALAYLVVGRPALAWGLGADYAAAWMPLMLLTAAHVATLWAGSTNMVLNMIGREREVLRAAIASVAVNLALSLLLVPAWGMMGAAVAAAAALVVWRVILSVYLRRALDAGAAQQPPPASGAGEP